MTVFRFHPIKMVKTSEDVATLTNSVEITREKELFHKLTQENQSTYT